MQGPKHDFSIGYQAANGQSAFGTIEESPDGAFLAAIAVAELERHVLGRPELDGFAPAVRAAPLAKSTASAAQPRRTMATTRQPEPELRQRILARLCVGVAKS